MRHKYPHTKRHAPLRRFQGHADAINQDRSSISSRSLGNRTSVLDLDRAIEACDMSISNMVLQDRSSRPIDTRSSLGAQLATRWAPVVHAAAAGADRRSMATRKTWCMAGFARTTHERLVQIINE
jgi:hypothetical protein